MDHLESMRVFAKVAEVSSFTHAADQLDISPAMATRAVVALETRLGVRLLQRTTRSVSLTDAGQTFLERTRSIMSDLDEAENMVAAQQRAPSGVVRIAAPVGFGLRHLSPLLKAFAEVYPQVVPDITLSNEVLNLVEGRFDVAIIPDGSNDSRTLIMRPFAASSLCLVAAPDYLAQHGMPQTLADLEQHVFLALTSSEFNVARHVVEPINETLQRVEKRIVANSMEMIYRFTRDGLGLAALPDDLVQGDIESGELVHLLKTVKLPTINWNIAYASRKNLPMKVRALLDFTIEYFGSKEIENRRLRCGSNVCRPVRSRSLPTRQVLNHAVA